MSNQEIYEAIDNIVKEKYPGLFQVKVFFRRQNVFDNVAEITIEKVTSDGINLIVFHKNFYEITKAIEEEGATAVLDKLDNFLYGYVSYARTYKRGDIVWANRIDSAGNEQSGRRPYIIVSNNKNNRYGSILTCVPMTTKNKKDLPTHFDIEMQDGTSVVLCEQITCLSKKEFCGYIREATEEEMKKVDRCIRIQLDLCDKNGEKVEKTVGKLSLIEKLRRFFNRKGEEKCKKANSK